jgi:hypothetical protein
MLQGNAAGQRDDEKILADLQSFNAVGMNDEKNVWAFWDRGLHQCPPWCQRNIVSWVRRFSKMGWTVRVLDMVDGSDSHYAKYLEDLPTLFPATFLDQSMSGPHKAPHSSDLIRLPLLEAYGGVWLDVSFMLFRDLDSLCWAVLSDPSNPFEMAAFKITMTPDVGMVFNGLIAARKGCKAIRLWHQTFVELWRDRVSTEGMSQHRLLHHLPRYEPPSLNGRMPVFQYAQFADYLAQVLCFERLRHLTDPSLGWDGPAYADKHVLLFDCVPEVYWAQRLTNWDGRKQHELLARKRADAPQDQAYEESNRFLTAILNTSSTMKISHGLKTAGREYLADIWDKPEHSNADLEAGTFAAHLRWASENHNDTHELRPVKLAVRPEAFLSGGLLTAEGNASE